MATKPEGEDFQQTTLLQLECPICLEYCVPPIYQCANGHNVCSDCFPKISECSLCRGPMTKVRNLFAEHISGSIKYPCRFRSAGCDAKFMLAEMDTHLKTCAFGISCQFKVRGLHASNSTYIPCEWRGPRSKLLEHSEQRHKLWTVRDDSADVKFSIRKHQTILFSAFNELFWCVFVHDFKTPCQRVHVFCAAQKDLKVRFTYEVTLTSEDEGCEIVNRRSVDGFSDELLEGLLSDQGGKYIIVSGRHMIERFMRGKLFQCSVHIVKE